MTGRPLVIGLGNRLRGDDGIGPALVAALERRFPDAADYLLNPTDPLNLINAWEDRQRVVLVDACMDPTRRAGDAVILEDLAGATTRLAAEPAARCSGHALDLRQTLELARVLRRAPGKLLLFAVVGQCFDPGAELSPALASAAPRLTRRLARML